MGGHPSRLGLGKDAGGNEKPNERRKFVIVEGRKESRL